MAVSLLCRKIVAPSCIQHHLICDIEDSMDADLAKALNEALPFIRAAVLRGDKVSKNTLTINVAWLGFILCNQILVHCERGVSRSASVVIAHLLEQRIVTSVADAIDFVKLQRPSVNPNIGQVLILDFSSYS